MQICIVSSRGIFVNRLTISKEHIIRLPVFRFRFFNALVKLNESFKTRAEYFFKSGSRNIESCLAKLCCANLITKRVGRTGTSCLCILAQKHHGEDTFSNKTPLHIFY